MKSPRMLYCVPSMVWTAISLATYSGTFVLLMSKSMEIDYREWNDNKKLSMALYAMILLGVGEVVGSNAAGYIQDKFGPLAGLKFAMLSTAIAYLFIFAAVSIFRFNWLMFGMTFFYGLQDASLQNFISCLCAFQFDSQLTPFAVF